METTVIKKEEKVNTKGNYQLTNTILYLDKVSLGYGEGDETKIVLKDVSLIEKNVVRDGVDSTGQVIAIVGRSGRGKSTLFKALTGLLKPLSGKILISQFNKDNKDLAKEVEQGDVGLVDQKYTLFRHKTVTESLMFALRKVNKTKEEKLEMITKYLSDWNLSDHKDKYPNELSGGQRQRTAIIEQIFSSKQLMIFDEPFSGLDPVAINSVKKAFDLIHQEDEMNTIVFSTHDIELAVELADSIYVVGQPEGSDFSTIVKHYDLKEMGLAWKEFGVNHLTLTKEIKELLLKS